MDTEITRPSTDIERTLAGLAGGGVHRRRWIKWAALAAFILATGWFILGRSADNRTTYVTQEVTRGALTVTVTATGNLEPRNQVDIGSELSGTIRSVSVDVNDQVVAGQVLAVLDTTRLKAQVLQAESSLSSAQARVIQSDASLKEAHANLERLRKVRELSGGKLPSQQDLDVAEAAVARAEGDAAAARAAVAQARANLEAARIDLGKAQIRSPINGIVLVRAVEPGQTVAASLQVATLFTLAEDLRKMELHVSVDEADVGAVAVGQQATFTVDAYPSRTFTAHITQVHFASNSMKQSASSSGGSSAASAGVVTYETVLEVDNSELLLRPGMTATAQIVTTSIEDAVLIPNAALRFTPPAVEAAAAGAQSSPLSALMPRMRMRSGGGGAQRGAGRRLGRAYILENGEPALILFRPGATDGRFTQVLEPGPMNERPGAMGSATSAAPSGPSNARTGPSPNAEELQRALQRTLEPGVQVIVDTGTAKP